MQCNATGGMTWIKRLATLSMEWKTREFLHMTIATALFPNARQKALMRRRFEFGKGPDAEEVEKIDEVA